MKLLLVSEGKHELRGNGERGALQIVVERMLEAPACEIETRKVSDPAIIVDKGKGEGMLKRFVAWMRYAARNGFDAIALVIDEDGDQSRLKQVEEAQDSTIVSIPRAIGLAIRSFDAWILADEMAMSNVLGAEIGRQPEIENIRDPKEVCRLLCSKHFSLSEFYALVLDRADLADLASRCPKGFAPFASRVRGLNSPA